MGSGSGISYKLVLIGCYGGTRDTGLCEMTSLFMAATTTIARGLVRCCSFSVPYVVQVTLVKLNHHLAGGGT